MLLGPPGWLWGSQGGARDDVCAKAKAAEKLLNISRTASKEKLLGHSSLEGGFWFLRVSHSTVCARKFVLFSASALRFQIRLGLRRNWRAFWHLRIPECLFDQLDQMQQHVSDLPACTATSIKDLEIWILISGRPSLNSEQAQGPRWRRT